PRHRQEDRRAIAARTQRQDRRGHWHRRGRRHKRCADRYPAGARRARLQRPGSRRGAQVAAPGHRRERRHQAGAEDPREMTIKTDDFAPAPDKRVVSAAPASPNEEAIERDLRPKLFAEYVGQAKTREQLEIFIGAAKKRGEALDHVLLFGPPGLGKTTLSHIIAHELGVNLRQTSGPVLEKPGDLAALLTNLEPRDVLFIDEIHRLSPIVEEILYPALEDFQIDIMIGEGPAARSV